MAYVIRRGYTGLAVKKMQHYLNVLRTSYPDLPVLKEDGSFGSATENAVMIFQKHTGLTADGIIGTLTWDKIIAKYKAAPGPGPVSYTHLDVYKRQVKASCSLVSIRIGIPSGSSASIMPFSA